MEDTEFKDLVGKTLTEIDKSSDEITLKASDGSRYKMYHSQDCCESVSIEDIDGDLNDLLNSPILEADVRTSTENPEGVKPEYQDSFTWTFYTIRNVKASVTIRWYGESNGYYSESVDFVKM